MFSTNSKLLGVLFLLAGMAVFGSATPVSKLVGEEFPIFTASLLRVTLGALALFPFVIGDLRADIRKIEKKDWGYLALISLFGMVGFTVFLIYGMTFVSGVVGSLIMSFTPALTAMLAFLFMGAPLDWRRGGAIGLGVIGLVIISVFRGSFSEGDGAAFFLGGVLVFCAIGCEACYTLLGKKVTDDVPPLTASFLACIMSLPLFVILMLLETTGSNWQEISVETWGALVWWGVGTLGLGSALWYSGLARTEGTTAAGFMAVMPVTALLLSYFLLGETFQPMHLLGIGFVLASVGIMSWVHMAPKRS